jgi:hypothetical protein
LPDFAAPFLEERGIPKGAKGSLTSFGARKILKPHELLRLLF